MAPQDVFVTLCILALQLGLAFAQRDGDLRLAGGTSSRSGRLEVYRNGEWVSIYDGGGFGLREAMVACTQLGYGSEAVDVYRGGVFQRGTSSVRLDGVRCEGGEVELMECAYSVCGTEDCGQDGDIAISCGSGDSRYIPRASGYRRWSGFVVLLIAIPFCRHAYKRRTAYGHHTSRSIIPMPRYHHGRVPLTSALDDTTTTTTPSSENSPSASYRGGSNPVGPQVVEQLPRVFTHGFVSFPPAPGTASLHMMSGVGSLRPAVDSTRCQPPLFSPSSQSSRGVEPCQSPQGAADLPPGYHHDHQVLSPSPPAAPPPEYSELDHQGLVSPTAPEASDSHQLFDPPPPYEDIVKT